MIIFDYPREQLSPRQEREVHLARICSILGPRYDRLADEARAGNVITTQIVQQYLRLDDKSARLFVEHLEEVFNESYRRGIS